MFCPKCGSILMPKKEGNKKFFVCNSCKYKTEHVEHKLVENAEAQKEVEVIDKEANNTLPKVKETCEKCGNKEAFTWGMQTRASDEPETRFFKCTKCGHTWREYA